MKKHLIFLFLAFFLNSHFLFSQKVLDLYLMLDETNQDMMKTKQLMIKKYQNPAFKIPENENPHMYLKTVDEKNGYIRVEGAFEGNWEMCYWSTKASKKIVAVNSTGCGPICNSDIKFFELENKKLIEKPAENYLPKIELSDFYRTEKMKSENNTLYKEAEAEFQNSIYILLELPQKGMNIKVNPQISDIYNEILLQKIEKYKICSMIEYIWQDGIFTKKAILEK